MKLPKSNIQVNGKASILLRYLSVSLLFGVLLVLLIHKIYNFDIWWHLKAGQHIIRNQHIPGYDIFSYTASNRLWTDLHWLFQIIAYGIWRPLGAWGLIMMKIVVVVSAFALLFKVGYRKEWHIVSMVSIFLAILVTSERFMVRPEILTLLFTSIYLLMLHQYKYEGLKFIWLLPVLQILWTNTQGLFIIGPVLIFAYVVGEYIANKIPLLRRWRCESTVEGKRFHTLLTIALLTVLACFINPYGFRGAVFPLVLFTRIGTSTNVYAQTIIEFRKTLSIHPVPFSIYFYKILVVGSLISFILNVKRTDLSRLLVYIGFLYLSLLARRNIALFALVAAPAMVCNVNSFLDSQKGVIVQKSKLIKNSQAIVCLFMSLLMLWLITGVSSGRFYRTTRIPKEFGFGISGMFYPAGGCDFVLENPISGNIFNDMAIGGYLIWRLYPQKKIFIDGRLEVYSKDFYASYLSFFQNYDFWKRTMDDYQVNCIILGHVVPGTQSLIQMLSQDNRWKIAYFDLTSIVFLKNTEENQEVIQKGIELSQSYKPGYAREWRQLAELFRMLGWTQKAITYYKKAAELDPRDIASRNNLGTFYLDQGMNKEALKILKVTAGLKPRLAEVYNNLGIAYFNLGDFNNAIRIYRKAMRLSRGMHQIHLNLGSAYEETGELDKAEKEYRKALALNPNYTKAHESLMEILEKKLGEEKNRKEEK
ncbi:Photosystem I assembly protein Ycf3 [subsurface metagenome]